MGCDSADTFRILGDGCGAIISAIYANVACCYQWMVLGYQVFPGCLPFYAGQRLTFTLAADIHQNAQIKCWLLGSGNGNTCVVSSPLRHISEIWKYIYIYISIHLCGYVEALSTYANWNANKPCRLYRRFMFKSPESRQPFVFRISYLVFCYGTLYWIHLKNNLSFWLPLLLLCSERHFSIFYFWEKGKPWKKSARVAAPFV